MRSTLLALVILALPSALPAASWVDGNGIEWTLAYPRANYDSARLKCQRAGYKLPSAEAFWQAIDLGLMDPFENQAFGFEADEIDWIWTNQTAGTSSFAWMASRWEDLAPEVKDERHWALCARRARE